MRHPFRRRNLAPRVLPLYGLGALALWLAEPSAAWLAAGGLVAAAGAGLRAWGAGHLVKTDRFVVSGPYALMRHPLYAGTLLAGLGLGVAAGPPGAALALGLFAPFFFLYYLPYKDRIEGARLERRYGADYTEWRRSVPALWPRHAPFRGAGAAGAGWSAERFRANDEAGALVAIAAAWLVLALRGLAAP